MHLTSTPLIDLSPLALLPPVLQAQFISVVDLLIVETVFPTLLIPIAICLFMFTKPEVRRKPVFILNVISIMLGLVFGGTAIAAVSGSIVGRHVSPDFVTALTGLYFFIPVCVQCILFVRIFAVYPPRVISKLLAVAIYGTLVAMTLARVVNLAFALQRISDATHLSHSEDPWAHIGVGARVPSVKAEIWLGLVYDIIASSLFLFRLYQGGALRVLKPADGDIVSSQEIMSYPARLRALFWIALTNFVVPVVFNIVLLVLVPTESSGGIISTIKVVAVVSVNVYVQIVSGLLATLWSQSGSCQEDTARSREGPVTESISTAKFALPSPLTSRVHVVEVETMHTSVRGGDLP